MDLNAIRRLIFDENNFEGFVRYLVILYIF
jgi:hypothetical protein